MGIAIALWTVWKLITWCMWKDQHKIWFMVAVQWAAAVTVNDIKQLAVPGVDGEGNCWENVGFLPFCLLFCYTESFCCSPWVWEGEEAEEESQSRRRGERQWGGRAGSVQRKVHFSFNQRCLTCGFSSSAAVNL